MKCGFLVCVGAPSMLTQLPFTAVPSVKRIVYSTCSIHATENEHVVRQALKTEEALNGRFTLASPSQVLPHWKRRGLTEEMDDAGRLSDGFTSSQD